MDISLLILVILFAILSFAFEWLPIDVTALVTLGLLLLFGLVTPDQAIEGFSNPAVITVMMMFILSEGLVRSGIVKRLGHRLTYVSGHSHWWAIVLLLLLAAFVSAFINNTAAVSILIPVGLQLSKHYDVSASKILLPLSYVAILGGTCTLIGTSTNLIVSAMSATHGEGAFTVFEFLPLGLVFLATGLVYLLVFGMRTLPSYGPQRSLTGKYALGGFLTEMTIPSGSKIVGQTVLDERVHERFRIHVLEVLRNKQRIAVDLRNTELEPDDVLIVRGAPEDLVHFRDYFGLLMLTDTKLQDTDLADEQNILAEIQLSPVSTIVGETIKELDFRRRFGAFVLALSRTGETVRSKLTSIPLESWDTLLVFGPRSRVEALYGQEEFIGLQELELPLSPPRRWWVSLVVVIAVVVAAALGVVSILEASILGVVVTVVVGALSIQQAYKAIDWSVIFLIACLIPLSTAMENSGLAASLGEMIVGSGDQFGAVAVLSIVYLVTAVVTEIMSNNAAAIVMVPIALTAAEALGVDAKPFLMAICFAGSASFLTPMGYQTNAMVYGPGGYRFLDYLRTGWPLKIALWALGTVLIPLLWPL